MKHFIPFIPACLMMGASLALNTLQAQPVDSARYRFYMTATDAVTGRSARSDLGFHPRATIGFDYDTLFGFTDHWYENDPAWVREVYPPPWSFFQEARIQNVRQKFPNALLFGNIHAYTGPSEVDTFIVQWNGDENPAGDSLYLYTHPQILSWPSVLRFYADSIILRDVSNNAQTVPGPYVRIDMTVDSSWTYSPPIYFNPDLGIYNVDPFHKGFFIYVYHPKAAPPPPDPVMLISPPEDTALASSSIELSWAEVRGAYSYKVGLATNASFSTPLVSEVLNSTTKIVSGLQPSTTYYWHVSVSNAYGVSYYQNPPRSFHTSSALDVRDPRSSVPLRFALLPSYPNPFNPSATIQFLVSRPSMVRLTIVDLLGRDLAVLANSHFQPGEYRTVWNASDKPTGVYFYRMTATPEGDPGSAFRSEGKMLLMR